MLQIVHHSVHPGASNAISSDQRILHSLTLDEVYLEEYDESVVILKIALQGVWCLRGSATKEVTRRCLEALELKGGHEGACKLLGDVKEVLGCLLEVLG
ncbi:hypothetical protein Tco_0860358 [Tanacetum coccineum]|uniref:Uncharacterized protein n=1 Tax=Tanacetum coccineum TaxID=301880 RepID=A0ABQ5BFA9_9ASTR